MTDISGEGVDGEAQMSRPGVNRNIATNAN